MNDISELTKALIPSGVYRMLITMYPHDELPDNYEDTWINRCSPKKLETLARIINDLPRREKTILILNFGLTTFVSRTHEEIGRMLNINIKQVERLLLKTKRMFRHPSRSKLLIDLLNTYK